MRFESLSALAEDLDRLLKIKEGEATTCREAPIFDNYVLDFDDGVEPFMGGHQGLMIISMPQGRFVYWNGKKPAELLRDDALWHTLIRCLIKKASPSPPLPKQESCWSTTALTSIHRTAMSTWRKFKVKATGTPMSYSSKSPRMKSLLMLAMRTIPSVPPVD
jgi:hypothetical protein